LAKEEEAKIKAQQLTDINKERMMKLEAAMRDEDDEDVIT
jgi:hypothetical protein